jgi:PAS domain S-box-containing protein
VTPDAAEPASPSAFDCLAGGGEMGERMRSFDWSQTALGPVEAWSPALRMMVRFLLANRFPLLLWWGPDYVSIYNDPYRPVLGTKHPWALGRPVAECWKEIWHILQPLIDTPFHGGPATWNDDIFLEINRHGFVEETHFTIAYSPVPDETVASGIGGVLATVHEITEKVVGERRVTALRDLGARVGEAKTAEEACAIAAETLARHDKDVPFALVYLIDGDGKRARLAGHAGVPAGDGIRPDVVDLTAPGDGGWPLARARRDEALQVIDDLGARFAARPPGPWSDPPSTAVVIPIASQKAHEPAGLLVLGVSARLRWDELYRGFFELVTSQVATAIANARAYEEERRRAEALAELDRAKTAFFSNVSHEFRTPLTLILGPLDDVLAETSAPRHREQLELLRRNALRLQKLVNTLLDFSRIEAGRIQACFEPTDLAALTAELASGFRSAVEKAGMRLTVDCRVDEPVYVDRDMYEKVVLNLVSNAFKFTLEGEIEVRLRDAGPSVELSVRDTGAGIAEEHLGHVFERFHRIEVPRARTQEGTGIGLALVHELVKLHGGAVGVTGALGVGSTFTVTLPKGKAHLPAEQIGIPRRLTSTALAVDNYLEEASRWLTGDAAPAPAIDITPSHEVRLVAPAPGPRARVVWADDNADMRDYVRRLLAPSYQVEAVADGEHALAAVRAAPTDLVLADVMMPRLDGCGLLRALRADDRTASIPVILLSARSGEEARVEGLQAGADDYLVKPFSARELVARVEAHLVLARLRRESSEALRRRAQQFETLLDVAPLGVYLVDADFRIAQVNPIAQQTFGNLPGGVVGRDFGAVVHLLWEPRYADELVRIFRHTLATGESYVAPERGEHRVDRNRTEYYEWRIDRIALPDGRFGLVCYFRDISQQVQTRKLIEQSRDALRESEQRTAGDLEAMTRLQEMGNLCAAADSDFHLCLQAMLGAAIAITAADKGNIQLIDPRTGALQIAAQRGFDDSFLAWFANVDREEATACAAAVGSAQRVIVEDVADSDIFRGQTSLPMLLRAGVRAVQSTPLVSSDGNLLGVISTHFARPHRPGERQLRLLDLLARQGSDFLERKEAEKALREADRRKDVFLATLAHELRNPLAPIRNSLHILRRVDLEGDRQAADTIHEMMERQVNHMVRLVDDLMDVSRITRGKIELRKEPVTVASAVRSAIETSRPLIDAAHHHLVVRLPTDALVVEADPVRLAQVLSNLLNNAAKYTEDGGQISLGARRDGAEVVISVRDSGIGIPADMLPRVFDLFVQVDRTHSRREGGLGIGLTLVRSLVDMHGGTIEARSDGPGCGSEFLIRLPLATAARGSARPLGRRPDVRTAMALHRILVVDDNRDAADSLSMLLRALGADVCTANDGQAALAALEAYHPSVMLLDIGMPGMDGYEIARRARQRVGRLDVTLIALTGWGHEEHRRRAREAGFDHHLVKPVDIGALHTLLASIAPAGRQREDEHHPPDNG